MTDQWYYGRDGHHAGPVSSQKLKELAEAGDLRPTDIVWKEGLSEWVPAAKVKGLFPKEERISTKTIIPTFGASTKTVVVACTNCKARYKVDEAVVIGNRVTCRACGNRIIVRPDDEIDSQVILPLPSTVVTSRQLQEDELALIRRRLSMVASDIPHHDIDTFGDRIALLDSLFVPCYRISVKTLYEQRSAERRELPYQKQAIPPLSVTEENVAPWSYEFVARTAFEAFTDEKRLDDSQAVQDCRDCSKSGQVTCPECSGHGEVACPECDGSTAVNCPQCSGRGATKQERRIPAEKKCWGCMGSGISHGGILGNSNPAYGKRCQNCYGRGYTMGYDTEYFDVPCNYCGTRGQVQCGNCRATGAVVCPTCQGNTLVTCPRCKGQTQLVTFLAVVRKLDPAILVAGQFDGDFDDRIRVLLDQHVGNQTNYPVVESAENSEISTKLSELPLSNTVPVLAQDIRRLLNEAVERRNDQCRIVWQSVTVQQTVASSIRYSFNDTGYDAWVVGESAELLPLRNPFSDLAQSSLDTAISAWNQGEKQRAIDGLLRCRAISSKDPKAKEILESNDGRIPTGLRVATAASSTMVAAKAKLLSGATKVSEAVDTVKNSVVGKWFRGLRGDNNIKE